MSDGVEYWSALEGRLNIKVVYITENTAKPPCFADADTLIVNPEREEISIYRYIRRAHRLVDIPKTFRLSPHNLYRLLRSTLMLVVHYDPSNPDHIKIAGTIPFVMDSQLQLSIASRARRNANIGAKNASLDAIDDCSDYHCYFDAHNHSDAFAVIRMLIEACTVISEVSTDFADIRSVLLQASRCDISVATGPNAQSAAHNALGKLRDPVAITKAISAFTGCQLITLEEWSDSVRTIESGLSPEALLVAGLQCYKWHDEQCKYVVIATQH